MSGPITNFELGKLRHREYEEEVRPYWTQDGVGYEKPSRSKKYKLVLALSGTGLAILLVAQMLTT